MYSKINNKNRFTTKFYYNFCFKKKIYYNFSMPLNLLTALIYTVNLL